MAATARELMKERLKFYMKEDTVPLDVFFAVIIKVFPRATLEKSVVEIAEYLENKGIIEIKEGKVMLKS